MLIDDAKGIMVFYKMPEKLHFEILPSSWHDLFAVQEIERACFQEDAWPLIELMAALTFPNIARFKAVNKELMAGFIAGDIHRNEQTGWIMTVGVLPDFRRQGVAEELMAKCEQAMQMPRIKLSVRRSNQAAIQLYQKLGYSQVDVWKNYYHDGEDGIVMEKKNS
jgi:ribosomal-protein-alanine acetyltransferase